MTSCWAFNKKFTTLFNKTVQKKSIETKIIRLFHHVPKTKNEWINRLIQRAVKLYILASQLNILHTLLLKFKWLEWVGINCDHFGSKIQILLERNHTDLFFFYTAIISNDIWVNRHYPMKFEQTAII